MKTPDVHFILINRNGKLSIVELDEIDPATEKELIAEAIQKNINNHGAENVRYCKVIPVAVKTTLSIGD